MRSNYSSEVAEKLDGKKVTLAGWVHEIRDMGQLKFLVLRDREGFIQITAKKETTDKKILEAIEGLSKESVIEVVGKVSANPRAPNKVEVIPEEIRVVALSAVPLPLDVTGKVDADLDTRLNNRFMDVRKPQVAAVFKIRARVQESFREFFSKKGFVEINPPSIIAAASEGGTELFAISYFEREAFLCQSPQLYKQMLMSSGLDKVFITMPVFRAESHNTTRHLNEIYQMDIEKAFIQDEEGVLEELEGVTQYLLKKVSEECAKELKTLKREIKVPKLPFKRITYDQALKLLEKNGIKMPWGGDFTPEADKKLAELIPEPFFTTQWPTKIRAFYSKPMEDRPEICRAFDLCYMGMEIASGAQRIHNHDELVEALKRKNLKPENFEFYLKAFRYGMPPHGGWSIGAERITEAITGVSNIRECVLYPRDRTRLEP
ncbi:MAG: aspartate--tRNA(Asn) ligase [Candidatus Altiarchaeales archaeon]|nr:aspartate--tRNA(Asn) ligase [Candidatus Altiarchaeales archaeon]